MKANFVRKAGTIEELKLAQGQRGGEEYVIERTVELGPQAYVDFSHDLLADYPFLAELVERMYVDTEKVWHCILVKPEGGTSGILVEVEGYEYARYAAYCPDC
jgi:hypothetical protein